MQPAALAALSAAVVVAVTAAALIGVGLRRGRRRAALESSAAQASSTTSGDAVTRRDAVNRGLLGVFGLGLAAMTAVVVRFLWPSLSGHTADRYVIGSAAGLRDRLARQRGPYHHATGGFFVAAYPAPDVPTAAKVYDAALVAGMRTGFVALSQRCPHQGCAVPWCPSSQWFECPCHGSKFDRVGERRQGPAARGMDHYSVVIDADGQLVVDTTKRYLGPPAGTDTTDQPAEGPHCT